MTVGVSAEETPSRTKGVVEGEGGEARSVVFYEGLRFWETQLYVFYVSGRLSGGSASNHAMGAGGSAKERLSRAWGEGGGVGGRFDFVVFYQGLRF